MRPGSGRRSSSDRLQGLCVREILLPGDGSLVLQQGRQADDGNVSAFDLERPVRIDGLVERYSVRPIQDVDSSRRQADLKDAVVGREVGLANLEQAQRSAEGGQGLVDARRVRRARSNEDVQILRGPWMAVVRDRVPAEHHELGAGVVKLDEEIAKVLGQVDQAGRQGTNRQGMRSRV